MSKDVIVKTGMVVYNCLFFCNVYTVILNVARKLENLNIIIIYICVILSHIYLYFFLDSDFKTFYKY